MNNEVVSHERQLWCWALRQQLGWPLYEPVNDCIAFSAGPEASLDLHLAIAEMAKSIRKDVIFTHFHDGSAEVQEISVAIRMVRTMDLVRNVFPYAEDDSSPLALVAKDKEESFIIGPRGEIIRSPQRPPNLRAGHKRAMKRLKAVAATIAEQLSGEEEVQNAAEEVEQAGDPGPSVVFFS